MDILLAFSLALLGLSIYLLHNSRSKKEVKNLPHGTMGWPILGETLGFFKPHESNSMGTFLHQRCSRYGKVFKSHLYGSPTIVSCDHELNMFVLQNEDKLFRASYPKAMHGILGNLSLLFVSGDLHKKLRSVVVSFVSASKSSPRFLRLVEDLSISKINSWSGRKEIFFCEEVKEFALGLLVKFLLNIEPGKPEAFKILEAFRTYMKGFVSMPIYFPGTAYANAVKARARLSIIVKEIIRERKMKEISSDVDELREKDFLDAILLKGDLTDEAIVSIVLDILLGGYQTTSTLIALIVYFLFHAPSALQTLKEEHQAIRKHKVDGEALNWQDYQKMVFTSSVIQEAMRCGNVVKFVMREAVQDIKFKEYIIPSGWTVLPVLTGAHLDPSLHENPSEFNPWRWSTVANTMSKKVMPFGGGPRLCPGAELAKVEISFFLHHLVLNYRWKTKFADDFPFAYPYVEFTRGLVLETERISTCDFDKSD